MSVQAYAVKSAKGKLEPFEYNPGPLGAQEVDVKVSHCGICHSDIAMIDNDWHFSRYPLVPGHEAVGVITAVGSNVSQLKVGQRVGVGWQSASCTCCEWCNRGREDLCAKQGGTIIGRHGGWADSVRVHWKFAAPIPEGIDSDVAGPMMCAGITVYAPITHYGVTPQMKTAVVGVGGLGHLAVQFLAAMGCEVTAISSSHDKDEEARKMGATDFIATRGSDELKKAAGRFDFILSTVSADVNWSQYISALRPDGRLVICGIPDSDLKIPAMDLVSMERSVSGGRSGSPSDAVAMFNFAVRHKIQPMCEFFPMKEVNAAVDHVRSGKARYRAVLVA